MKTFVIADIHGAHKVLLECFKKSGFDKKKDRLICLGDVCDRGWHTKECVDELLTVRNLIYILGNHDLWAMEWNLYGQISKDWQDNGGLETVKSYKGQGLPKEHMRLFAKAPLWYKDKNRLFVHGGFDSERSVEETPNQMLLWDRTLLNQAQDLHNVSPDWKFGGYDEIFIGHTPTTTFGEDVPKKFCNVWAMDTGAGHMGCLTIMDVETKKFWQSE
ncbi:MAG: serine/threonine protein phosphatase [Candidatus Omnitrophica bacterium]|nr:serine/threonine protein phosphatase [Candidatus Omnitrophota bacterium]